MKNLILTIIDPQKRPLCDVELPDNQPFSKLLQDLYEALDERMIPLLPSAGTAELFHLRRNAALAADQTLSSSGVWNGDYLQIRRKQ